MLVYGKNVAREILNSKENIKKIYIDNDFKDIEILNLINNKKITPEAAHKLVEKMPNNSKTPTEIGKEMDVIGVADDDLIQKVVIQVIDENPEAVADYNEGKGNALNYLVGQVMRLTRGKANAKQTNSMLKEQLDK